MYRLRDERGLYSDSSAVGLMRLALIELGRRLFAAGRIGFQYDTLDLHAAEIDAILDGSPTPTADELDRPRRGPQGSKQGSEPRPCSARRLSRRRPSTASPRRSPV